MKKHGQRNAKSYFFLLLLTPHCSLLTEWKNAALLTPSCKVAHLLSTALQRIDDRLLMTGKPRQLTKAAKNGNLQTQSLIVRTGSPDQD